MSKLLVTSEELMKLVESELKPSEGSKYLNIYRSKEGTVLKGTPSMKQKGAGAYPKNVLDITRIKRDYNDLVNFFEDPLNSEITLENAGKRMRMLQDQIEDYTKDHVVVK